MPTRFDPFTEFDRLVQATWPGQHRQPTMPMDAYRRGDEFVVQLDLPGVDPASIEVTVDKGVLTVAASRSWQQQEGDVVVARERRQGTATRQLRLGEGLDAARVRAAYDAGVLTVTVPVAEQAKPRRVEVTLGGGQVIDTHGEPEHGEGHDHAPVGEPTAD